MKKNENNKGKQPNAYLVLTGIAIQMGALMYGAAYFGKKLDAYYNNEKLIWTMLLILVALFLSIYLTLAQLKRINKGS